MAEQQVTYIYQLTLTTPLGPMLALAKKERVFYLRFEELPASHLPADARRLINQYHPASHTLPGRPAILQQLENEVTAYFEGRLTTFVTPVALHGTTFQQQAWQTLRHIPYGQTRSYRQQAEALHCPRGFRAVGAANRANHLALIIPCHRIINHNGNTGGYAGGPERKRWLLAHERRHSCFRD